MHKQLKKRKDKQKTNLDEVYVHNWDVFHQKVQYEMRIIQWIL